MPSHHYIHYSSGRQEEIWIEERGEREQAEKRQSELQTESGKDLGVGHMGSEGS